VQNSSGTQVRSQVKIRGSFVFCMNTLHIAVGSARRPKLNALREVAASLVPLFGPETSCEVLGYEVESGVSHTPASREELMRGARQRAEALRSEGVAADFFVGVEGGLDIVAESGERRVFLES
jgi:non-canonical (house-cleaning) NTP pyrophosphatase